MSPAAAGRFAPLTPPGEGGIAVYAVEGPGARAALLAAVRSTRLAALRPGQLAYGRLLAADGTVLDEVIVACLPPGPLPEPSAVGHQPLTMNHSLRPELGVSPPVFSRRCTV